MRWSYKTVHYELKKEGLLGSAFLDESELELSLNEYGKAGWELISMLETLDGLIAVFKQPLSLDSGSYYPMGTGVEESTPGRTQVRNDKGSNPAKKVTSGESVTLEKQDELVLVDDYEVVDEFREEEREHDLKLPKPPADVGTIRIE
ncbi:MAG: DUF4177 domain-containing protein [Desulforhopalus sp.]